MNKKTILAGFLSLSMLASMGLSAFAATEATPSSALTTSAKSDGPSSIEANYLNNFLKKYGWDKQDKGALSAKDFHKDYASNYFDEADLKNIAKLSESVELRGWTDEVATTLYTFTKSYQAGDYHYDLVFALFMDVRTGMVDAAAIKRLPSNEQDAAASIYNMATVSLSEIEKDATAYAKANIFAPGNKLAQLSLIPAYKVSDAANKGLRQFWVQRGWANALKWTFYQNTVDASAAVYLSDAEVNQAMKVSAEATNGMQVAMMMPATGFYFTERSYRISGTENRFFVDFVASGINPLAEGDKLGANFAFLIVKPAKANQDGSLDKYFYSTNTSINSIAKDMNKIFAQKVAPVGAQN